MAYQQPDPSEGVTPLGKRGTGAYLSPRQFISMRRVRKLRAVDTPEHYSGEESGTVADLIPTKQHQVEWGIGDTADYEALGETMAREGPKGTTVPPILIEKTSGTDTGTGEDIHTSGPVYNRSGLGNGGHRVAIAHELNWPYMRWTSDRSQSGYGDDRFPHNFDSGGYNSNDWESSPSSSSDSPEASASVHSRVPGDRSYMPPGGALGKKSQAYSHAIGEAWHRGGDILATHGLHTELHGKPIMNESQFAGTRMGLADDERERRAARNAAANRQLKLPGMPLHFVGGGPTDYEEYRRHNAGPLDKLAEALRQQRAQGAGPETLRGMVRDFGPHTSAPHGRWPGGGKILTGDLD